MILSSSPFRRRGDKIITCKISLEKFPCGPFCQVVMMTSNSSSRSPLESDDEEESYERSGSTVIEFIDDLVVGEEEEEDDSSSVNNLSSSAGVLKGQKKKERRALKLKKDLEKEELSSDYATTLFESAAVRAAHLDQRRKVNDDYVQDLRHKGLHTLSGEIDRCLKKVSEGVETFEDIWQKVHNATNTNQKEKYEADLKKEIKKLQRLRDQIKSWIASGEIKDKSTLVDTRKLIETQMERFKVVERETKTKAYSKEGLGAAQKLDPTTREREELNNWLSASIDSIQIQIDQFECEIELILAAKKKRLDKDKQDRMDELKNSLERHRFHVTKLETLMRMLDNLAVDVEALRTFLCQVKKIKDDIDYYLDSNQEPEFEENEFIYDDIEGLEDFDESLLLQQQAGAEGEDELGVDVSPTSLTSGNNSGNNSPISPVHSSDASDPEKTRKSSDDSSKVVRPVAMKANQSNHSPSPGGGSKSSNLGAVGTPPKGVGTPNNSSPSSGLSNHVSSLSSLSSSPTHNYHNALNNSKSIVLSDSMEHNNSSTTGISRALSKSPPVNSNFGSFDGLGMMSSVNGVLENGNGNGSPLEDHSSPVHTQQLLITSSSSSIIIGSSVVTLENGLISPSPPPPPPQQQEPSSPLNNNFMSSSSSSSGGIGSQQIMHQHQLFGNPCEPPQQQQPSSSSFLQQTFNGLAAAVNNLSEGFALGVSSSSSLISNPNNSSGSNSSSVFGGSSNVIGLSGIVVGGIGIQESSVSATTTGVISVVAPGGVTPNSINSLSASVVSSHNNSSSGILSQQHIQQLQQQLHQGPSSQSGMSLESSPISEYLRLQSQDQILLNRILNESDSMASLKSMAQDVLDRSGLSLGDHSKSLLLENKTREAHIPPLLGVAPLGPVPLQKDHQTQFQMTDSAHSHVPVSADSERMRQFLPRNPYPTPHYYPQHPLSNSDTFEFFQRLSIETLFFIFYYLEGTKAQYLAAKVLKKQSWRFHTKYMMWFQRHEEPKVINDEYEQGTYVYFDIEKWGQRKKDGFVFEYRYLEDRDLG